MNTLDSHADMLAMIGAFQNIVLRGSGNVGQQILEYLLAEGLPKEKFCFWDKKAGYVREISGVPVLAPFSGNPPAGGGTLIIHCITSLPYDAHDYAKHGYASHMDGFFMLCPYNVGFGDQMNFCQSNSRCALLQCPRQTKNGFQYVPYRPNTGESAEIFLVDRFTFSINTKCSLKCRHCQQYINNFPPEARHNFPLARILADIDLACTTHDFIRIVSLLGGEPFLHPDLSHIIRYFLSQPNVGIVQIFSNGVCRISERTMAALQNERVHLRISAYIGVLDGKQEAIVEKNLCQLRKHGISHTFCETQWTLAPTLVKQERSIAALQDLKQHCVYFLLCRTFVNGIYYPCSLASTIALHGIADYVEDRVLLTHALPKKTLRERIIALNARPYYQSCAHCDFSSECVLPGEQGVDARYAHIGKKIFPISNQRAEHEIPAKTLSPRHPGDLKA
jgi:hypothetical protein